MNPAVVVAHQIADGDYILLAGLLLLGTWLVSRGLVLLRLLALRGRLDRLARACGQIGTLLGLEQAYEFGRGQIPLNTDLALLNAYRVLDLEWHYGLFIEERTQRFFLHFHLLMKGIDLFYIVGHVGVTISVLIWVYFRHRDRFPAVRNLLMVATAIALVAFYLYPTAPPRLLGNYGFVDPLEANHLIGPGGSQANSYTYNPYAAMPSLHVAYALVAAYGLWSSRKRWVRAAAVLYPLAMSAVVIISGNHWVLDVIGAFLTVLLAWVLLRGSGRVREAFTSRPAGSTA